MSTLKVTNIQSNAAGFNDVVSFQNSGGTQNGTLCRAFINFNGTGVIETRASFNVSEITDNGVGDYTIIFTNALVDANYSAQCTSQFDQTSNAATAATFSSYARFAPTTLACRISTQNSATVFDMVLVSVAIFR